MVHLGLSRPVVFYYILIRQDLTFRVRCEYGLYHGEPRLNATLTFTLHDKATSNATNFWLFFDVAYVSPFKFCSVMSYQQQQRDMYATCDTYATIFRRLNATFLRTQLPSPLVNNLIVFLGFPPPLSPSIPQFSGMWAFH